MPLKTDRPEAAAIVSAWIIGRGYCPVCQVVETIVRDPQVVYVGCARCGHLVELEATGDEA